MQFRSTKNKFPLVTFKEAMLKCLPDDGGLFVPSQIEDFREFLFSMNKHTTFYDLVAAVAPAFFKDEVNIFSAAKIAKRAFNFQPELIKLDDGNYLLNLYNGPTGGFKDFGIAFMSAMFEEIVLEDVFEGNEKNQYMIVSAAKPDTGISMANAFAGKKNIKLVLLYPSGQIRGLDPSLFAHNGGNILPIQIKGTFDDCQRLIIETINDKEFSSRYRITSGSSMNSGRLFPQIFYYLYAFTQIKDDLCGDLVFSVPCGNFGSFTAGLYAWRFGMPVNGFIAGMNANNAAGDYFLGKQFIPKPLINTNSPALDVSVPINQERLELFYSESPAVMRNMVFPVSINDEITLKTMKYVYDKYKINIDTHTAVAFAAAKKTAEQKKWSKSTKIITLATSHPARYAHYVEYATGKQIDIPHSLQVLHKRCDPVAVIPPELEAFKIVIAGSF